MAECMQSTLRIDLWLIGMHKHDTRGSEGSRHDSLLDDAVSDSSRSAIASSTNYFAVGRQTQLIGRRRVQAAGDLFGFVNGPKQTGIQLQFAQQSTDGNFFEHSAVDARLRELRKQVIEEEKEKQKQR